jgi:hypothetical protein
MAAQGWVACAWLVAGSSFSAPSVSMAQPPLKADAAIPATVALVESWPDGRTNYELTSPRRASMWMPGFPRVDGYTLPDGAKPGCRRG